MEDPEAVLADEAVAVHVLVLLYVVAASNAVDFVSGIGLGKVGADVQVLIGKKHWDREPVHVGV